MRRSRAPSGRWRSRTSRSLAGPDRARLSCARRRSVSAGRTSTSSSASWGRCFPRIQGHEVCAVVDEVGPGVEGVRAGDRVALWPVLACGECYPCSIGRGNACSRIRILGVHLDGALQERLLLPAAQLFPVGDQEPAVAALVEPVSIGVRTASRARIDEGERVVVLGAGPDRAGRDARSARPRRLGAPRRPDREPSRARRVARRRRPRGRRRRRSGRRGPRLVGRRGAARGRGRDRGPRS